MAIDQGKLHELLGRAVVDVGAVFHAGLVLIGDQLGLYRALADGGPATSAELARTDVDQRAVRAGVAEQLRRLGGYVDL